MRNNEGFRTFPYCFGTFLNDFKLGANETGIFSICKGIFSYCKGFFFENGAALTVGKVEKLAQVRKKSLRSLNPFIDFEY